MLLKYSIFNYGIRALTLRRSTTDLRLNYAMYYNCLLKFSRGYFTLEDKTFSIQPVESLNGEVGSIIEP